MREWLLRVLCCVLFAILLVAGTGSAVPAGADNALLSENTPSAESEKPYAEAGLDQTVGVGTLVYLDAYGSRAAEGELVGFEWTIERPDGTTIEPACGDCELTEFRPRQTGEYAVTVTVRDEAGREASDTMYVTVVAVEPPEASLSGPNAVAVGEDAEIGLGAEAPGGELVSVSWFVDGEPQRATALSGEWASDMLEIEAQETGERTVMARVWDWNGTSRTVRHNVTVREPAQYAVEITEYGTTDRRDNQLQFEAEITNTGGMAGSQDIEYSIEDSGMGEISGTTAWSLSLAPGESATVSERESLAEPRFPVEFTVWSVDDRDSAELREEDADDDAGQRGSEPYPYYEVEIDLAEEVEMGESVDLGIEGVVVWPGGEYPDVVGNPSEKQYSTQEYISLGPGDPRQSEFDHNTPAEYHYWNGWPDGAYDGAVGTSNTGNSNSYRGVSEGTARACVSDGLTEDTAPSSDWATCEDIEVVDDDESGGGDPRD